MTPSLALARYAKAVKKLLRSWLKGSQLAFRVATLAALGVPLVVLFPLSTWSSAAGGEEVTPDGKNTSTVQQPTRPRFDPALHNPDSPAENMQSGGNVEGQEEEEATIWEKALWRYLRWAIGQAGPTCIKMAQWASTRDDLFAAELCQKLAELQQEAPPHPWRHTEATLVECFGKNWASRLHIADKDKHAPLGSGCVAQVYRGRVLGGGGEGGAARAEEEKDVAIKVLHPRIFEQVTQDLCLLRWAAGVAERLVPDLATLGPRKVVDDFGLRLEEQLDLRKEAQHLMRFRRNFGAEAAAEEAEGKGVSSSSSSSNNHSHEIEFPRPLVEGSLAGSSKVLIETFVDHATPILEFIQDASVTEETKKALSGICLKAIMKMVLLDNMLHGDLHPGNIMVRDLRNKRNNNDSNNNHPSQQPSAPAAAATTAAASVVDALTQKLQEVAAALTGALSGSGGGGGSGALSSSSASSSSSSAMAGLQVVFLDAGLSIDLDEYAHKNLVGILRAFTELDGRRAAKLAVEASDRAAALEALEGGDSEWGIFGNFLGSSSSGSGGGLVGSLFGTSGQADNAAPPAGGDGTTTTSSSSSNTTTRGSTGNGGGGDGAARDRARETALEQFYDGCHDVMQQAADSEQLTLELGNHMRNMFALACEHRIRLEPYFVSVALAVRVMEGIASRLDHDVQLRPFAAEIFKQMPVERQLEAVGLRTPAKVAATTKAKAAEASVLAVRTTKEAGKAVEEAVGEAEKKVVEAAESLTKGSAVLETAAGLARRLTASSSSSSSSSSNRGGGSHDGGSDSRQNSEVVPEEHLEK